MHFQKITLQIFLREIGCIHLRLSEHKIIIFPYSQYTGVCVYNFFFVPQMFTKRIYDNSYENTILFNLLKSILSLLWDVVHSSNIIYKINIPTSFPMCRTD